MQAMKHYLWAQEQVQTVTKEHRESEACQRRLKQMQAKRDKAEKRAAAATASPPKEQ